MNCNEEAYLSLQKLQLPPLLYDVVSECDNEHFSTKFHRETLLTHLHACGKMCEELSGYFQIPMEVAYWVGFLHDIGKPLARRPFLDKQKKTIKRVNYIGHAQFGACLAQYILTKFAPTIIPEEYHDAVLYCIDNHMCCCSHNQKYNKRFHASLHMTLTKDKERTIRMLCMLFAADNLSRISDETVDRDSCVSQSLALKDTLLASMHQNHISQLCMFRQCTNDKIILLLYGLSGSGKSTFCEKIKQFFSDANLKIAHVERDASLFHVATSFSDKPMTYKEAYTLVTEQNAKPFVQTHWVSCLTRALEDATNNLIVIDTMQTMFFSWQHTLEALSEEAKSTFFNSLKVGVYFVPMHQLGYDVENKTNHVFSLPNEEMFMPNVNLELGTIHTNHLDIASGWGENTLRWCKEFLSQTLVPKVPLQKTFCALLQEHGSLQAVIELFPAGLLEVHGEYEDERVRIFTVSYMDGRQIFVGPSRDYRGESICYCKKENTFNCLRGSLPVFPDWTSIEKDPGVFPYILDCAGETAIPKHWVRDLEAKSARYVMTYKYDGSLFNIVFLPKHSEMYEIIHTLMISAKVPWLYSNIPSGCLVYGSKGRFGFHTGNPVKNRGMEAIKGSYGSLENFEEAVETFLAVEGCRDKMITLHFEAIDTIPTSELTVYYKEAFCPFFGYTEFTDTYKKFHLVEELVCPLRCRTPTIEKHSWQEVMEAFAKQREGLLGGDEELEPEGCVVHIFGENNEWFPVKLKHDFYYVAHKPTKEMNQKAAKEIEEDSKYEKLRERLVKCRAKPPICELLKQLDENVWDMFDVDFPTRKDAAIYWNLPENKKKTEQLQQMCERVCKEYYGVIKARIWKWMMDAYPARFTLEMCSENIKNEL